MAAAQTLPLITTIADYVSPCQNPRMPIPYQPLTTVFTPPAACATSWVFENGAEGTVWGNQEYIPDSTNCLPNHGHQTAFGPGICGSGLELKQVTKILENAKDANQARWHGLCCSSNFHVGSSNTDGGTVFSCIGSFPAPFTALAMSGHDATVYSSRGDGDTGHDDDDDDDDDYYDDGGDTDSDNCENGDNGKYDGKGERNCGICRLRTINHQNCTWPSNLRDQSETAIANSEWTSTCSCKQIINPSHERIVSPNCKRVGISKDEPASPKTNRHQQLEARFQTGDDSATATESESDFHTVDESASPTGSGLYFHTIDATSSPTTTGPIAIEDQSTSSAQMSKGSITAIGILVPTTVLLALFFAARRFQQRKTREKYVGLDDPPDNEKGSRRWYDDTAPYAPSPRRHNGAEKGRARPVRIHELGDNIRHELPAPVPYGLRSVRKGPTAGPRAASAASEKEETGYAVYNP
ncbi:Uu.00g005930.m01.CDS01 [Anthostomella pinea]|uniref:Uu.00g005930.m01.CDS01 n=1 Tax=Anthostomella pinea TaxID=933095 RepID=A0AAI8VKB7_9PEZI|nr:Uu.00g005930.m01.CDS01 [Anthostomella pinea]